MNEYIGYMLGALGEEGEGDILTCHDKCVVIIAQSHLQSYMIVKLTALVVQESSVTLQH